MDNTEKLGFMRSLGADEVIDYRTRNVTRDRGSYDLVLDLVVPELVRLPPHRDP